MQTDFTWHAAEGGYEMVLGKHAGHFPVAVRTSVMFVSRATPEGVLISTDMDLHFDHEYEFIRPSNPAMRVRPSLARDALEEWGNSAFSMNALLGRQYRPLDESTALFQHFADIQNSDDVLAFANRWGGLGFDACWAMEAVPRDSESFCWAEPLVHWFHESSCVDGAIQLWKVIRDGDVSAMASRVTTYMDKLYVSVTDQWETGVPPGTSAEPQAACRAALAVVVNEGLRGRVDLKLGGSERPAAMTPISLLGAIWLQLLLAIEHNVDLRRCLVCGDWFEIGAGRVRREKKYCSGKCKQHAYRNRIGEDSE